jgi:hydroxymethylglutaryl-CoA lyase
MMQVKITECPRDAMQGIHTFIPTEFKIEYLNALLKVGFEVLDFGSFVSPKAIPQMQDTAQVLKKLDLNNASTKLLAIVANERGAREASAYDEITFLGYPFSISETFQKRNTNAGIAESLQRVSEIKNICDSSNKTLLIYISMAFGNPYGDEWSTDIAIKWCNELYSKIGIKDIALADTTGISNPENIKQLFSTLIPSLPEVNIGAHLHTTPQTWQEKIEAAWQAGCRSFDGAIKGFGGCPMAADKLTGNMPTEKMLSWFKSKGIHTNVKEDLFNESLVLSYKIFNIN